MDWLLPFKSSGHREMHNVVIIKKERMQSQTSKLSWERMESNGGWQGEASSGEASGGGGTE